MDTEIITFNDKGQVVIPATFRRKYRIKDGTKAVVSATAVGILLRPITHDYIRSLRGSLRGLGVMQALTEDRRGERESG